MSPRIFRDQFGIQIYLDNDDHHYIGFDYTPAGCKDQACDEVVESYGMPAKGLMVVRDGNRWATSDGVDSATGEPYTPEVVEAIRGCVDELIVLDD